MRRAMLIAASTAMLALGGCKTLPVYEVPAGATAATVNMAVRGWKTACVDGTHYRLVPDDQGNVRLQAGVRVTLRSDFSWNSGNVSWSCHPASSFVPDAEHAYSMVFEVEPENHACTFLAYRQTTANRIGLDFERTIGPPQACPL